jgi:hypothetical protein
MLLNRQGDLGVEAVVLGVEPPHVALQLGELADHQGQEVGLGQGARLERHERVRAEQARQGLRQGADALLLVGHGAQALHPAHLHQALAVLGQGRLAVFSVEELRVVEPRGEHPFVAFSDERGVAEGVVAHGQDHVRELAVAQRGEDALVHPHRLDEQARRQVQQLFSEGGGQGHGPLHEVRHLVDERLVQGDLDPAARGDGGEALADDGAALGPIGQHMAIPQGGEVSLGVRDGARRQGREAVADDGVGGGDPRDGGVDARAAVDRDHLVEGPTPAGRAAAPAHRLLERQAQDERLKPARDQGRGGLPARGEARGDDLIPLGADDLHQLFDAHTVLLGEAQGRAGPGAVFFGDAEVGAVNVAVLDRARAGHALHDDAEAARRREGAGGAVLNALEQGQKARLQAVQGRADHRDRQLLTTNLDQQVGGRHHSPSTAARSRCTPSEASAQAHARSRIRLMYWARSATEMAPRALSTLNRCEALQAWS